MDPDDESEIVELLSSEESPKDVSERQTAAPESKTRSQSDDLSPERLCVNCSRIPFQELFDCKVLLKQKRHVVGTTARCAANRDACIFCGFIAKAAELGNDSLSESASWSESGQISLLPTTAKPWYHRAGVEAEMPPLRTCLLQLGSKVQDSQLQAGVVISCLPAADNSKQREMRVFGSPRLRNSDEANSGLISMDVIRSWISTCKQHHHQSCEKPHLFERQTLSLRLIDTETRVVVPISKNLSYVALSYVWGDAISHMLPSSAESALAAYQHPKSPKKWPRSLPSQVPQTVEDAIIVTKALGVKYLWVDKYCIDQCDKQDLEIQIRSMGLIYQCAHATILACDGAHANRGLAGVSRPLGKRQQPKVSTSFGDFTATFIESFWDHMGRSAWDSRAWTMQEGVLSRRCIMFNSTDVRMKCQQELFYDGLPVPVSTKASRTPTFQSDAQYLLENYQQIKLEDPEWKFSHFNSLVSIYTMRHLSIPEDILRACRGALGRVTQITGMEFIWGMPQRDLLRSLLWKPHYGHSLERRLGFPSWSWTGWIGRIEYHYWLDEYNLYEEEARSKHATKKSRGSRKRKRNVAVGKDMETCGSAFISTEHVVRDYNNSNDNQSEQILKISSTIARFKIRRLRRHGSKSPHQRSGSQQLHTAIGDHWTLVTKEGLLLQDKVGEHEKFEQADHFFRLDPQVSNTLLLNNNDSLDETTGEFLFMKYWPWIRDCGRSRNWLRDKVSALLIMRQGSSNGALAWRVASVMIDLEDWLAANPKPAVVDLV